MKSVTLRMPEELWQAAHEEGELTNMSASEFVRMATLTAVAFRRGRRGHEWGELLEAVLYRRVPRDKP